MPCDKGAGHRRMTGMAGARRARGDVVQGEAETPKDRNYGCPWDHVTKYST